MPTNKIGLGYKSKTKYNSNKNMLELQPENLTYDESLYLYHSLNSNDDNTSDRLISTYSFNNDISINMVQIEQINNKDIESIFLFEKNIRESKEYDSNYKTWMLEEGSHIVIEETIDVNISDDPGKPKII